MSDEAIKDDRCKPRVDLIPPKPILAVGRVLGHGAKKYSENNWRKGSGLKYSHILGAIERHLLAIKDCEDIDPEFGEQAIDHLICEALFLSEFMKTGGGIDDRWRDNDKPSDNKEDTSEKETEKNGGDFGGGVLETVASGVAVFGDYSSKTPTPCGKGALLTSGANIEGISEK